MIHGPITLKEVDEAYQRFAIKELVVIPWYEHEPVPWTLAGLITGYIDEYSSFPGSKSGFLEHFIVLPEAQDKLRVMQQMPKLAATLLAGKVERLLLCIAHNDTRRERLGSWARRCGYTKFGEADAFDWYVKPLTGEVHGQETPEDAGSGEAHAAASAASGP